MNFQIYQLEKSQALDILDRASDRLTTLANEGGNYGDSANEDLCNAIETLTAQARSISELRTQLDIRETALTVADIAQLVRGFDDQAKYGKPDAVGYFARYFSNYGCYTTDFLLAAGYALPERDKLLFEDVDEVNWKEEEQYI